MWLHRQLSQLLRNILLHDVRKQTEFWSAEVQGLSTHTLNNGQWVIMGAIP